MCSRVLVGVGSDFVGLDFAVYIGPASAYLVFKTPEVSTMGEDNIKQKPTLFDRLILWAKNHPIIAPLMFVGVVVIAIGTVLAAVTAISVAYRSCNPPPPPPSPGDTTQNSDPPQEQVFTLIGFSDDALVAAIERETGYKYSKSSRNNRIKFTYTGRLIKGERGQGSYYTGGAVRVLVDERECTTFTDLRINSTPKIGGNPDEVLEKFLSNRPCELAAKNAAVVASGVKHCLK